MATATKMTLAHLVKRLKSLSEDQQLYHAYAFMEQQDCDEKLDALIESTPDALKEPSERALAEHSAGRTRPLTDEDFAVDDD